MFHIQIHTELSLWEVLSVWLALLINNWFIISEHVEKFYVELNQIVMFFSNWNVSVYVGITCPYICILENIESEDEFLLYFWNI